MPLTGRASESALALVSSLLYLVINLYRFIENAACYLQESRHSH